MSYFIRVKQYKLIAHDIQLNLNASANLNAQAQELKNDFKKIECNDENFYSNECNKFTDWYKLHKNGEGLPDEEDKTGRKENLRQYLLNQE